MALPCYLAMTAAEFDRSDTLPAHPGWMACHFSGFGSGLSNLPQDFPAEGMVIVNDQFPIDGHDAQTILQDLKQVYESCRPKYFLLDFQRPGVAEITELVKLLCDNLPCPVAASHHYAKGLNCPVFLPPPPLHKPLKDHIAPWDGRDIFLEIAPETLCMTVTKDGCAMDAGDFLPQDKPVFSDEGLCCDYYTELWDDRVIFTLRRNIPLLLEQAETLGIRCCVGLYQQLADYI